MSSSSVLRNSLFYAGMRAMASATALGLTWLIAHRAPAQLGVFRTLLVFFVIAEMIPLLGMHSYLFREVSLHPHCIKKYAFHGFALALSVSLLVIAGLILVAYHGNYSQEISHGLLIIATGLPATAAYACAVSILVGLSQGAKLGAIQGAETLARTAVGVTAVLLGWSVLAVITGYVICRWLVLVWFWWELAPQARGEKWQFDPEFFRQFLSHLPTFAGINLLALIGRSSAQLMLPWMKTDEAAGQFGAAYLFIDLVLLVPNSFITNLVPRFSAHARDSRDTVRLPCMQGIKIMALGVLPAVALITVHAGDLIHVVFSSKADYSAAIPILQVAIWVSLLSALDQVFALTMLACGKQSMDLKTLAVGATVMLVTLYYSIAAYGAFGAALGILIGNIAIVVTRLAFVYFLVPGIHLPALLWRPVAACAGAIYLASLFPSLPWVINAGVAGILYLAGLALLGSFRRKERDEMFDLLGPHTRVTSS